MPPLCEAEIQFIKDRKADTHRLSDLASAGQLPLRVTHNDTKLNNVLFDATAGEAIYCDRPGHCHAGSCPL